MLHLHEMLSDRVKQAYHDGTIPSYRLLASRYTFCYIARKYTIINANLKLINAKIHLFYSIDIR